MNVAYEPGQFAEYLISSVDEQNIKSVLHYLHFKSHANPEMNSALNRVLGMLQAEQKLLRAALFGELLAPSEQLADVTTKAVQTRSGTVTGQPEPQEVPLPDLRMHGIKLQMLEGPRSTSGIAYVDLPTDLLQGCCHRLPSELLAAIAEGGACDDLKAQNEVIAQVAQVKGHVSDEAGTTKIVHEPSHKPPACVLLNFNRHPQEFHTALLSSDLAGELEARGVNVCPDWSHGAKIFVANLTEEALEQAGISCDTLRPWHVLVLKDDEPRVHSALRYIKCRPKPRLQSERSFLFTLPSETALSPGDVRCL